MSILFKTNLRLIAIFMFTNWYIVIIILFEKAGA